MAVTDPERQRLDDLDRKRDEMLTDALVARLKELGVTVSTQLSEALWQAVEDHA